MIARILHLWLEHVAFVFFGAPGTTQDLAPKLDWNHPEDPHSQNLHQPSKNGKTRSSASFGYNLQKQIRKNWSSASLGHLNSFQTLRNQSGILCVHPSTSIYPCCYLSCMAMFQLASKHSQLPYEKSRHRAGTLNSNRFLTISNAFLWKHFLTQVYTFLEIDYFCRIFNKPGEWPRMYSSSSSSIVNKVVHTIVSSCVSPIAACKLFKWVQTPPPRPGPGPRPPPPPPPPPPPQQQQQQQQLQKQKRWRRRWQRRRTPRLHLVLPPASTITMLVGKPGWLPLLCFGDNDYLVVLLLRHLRITFVAG